MRVKPTADREPSMASSATTVVHDCDQSCRLYGALGVMDRSYKRYLNANYTDRDYKHKPLEGSDTKMVLSLGVSPNKSIRLALCRAPIQLGAHEAA